MAVAVAAIGVIASPARSARSYEPLRDAPVVWHADDRNDIAEPRPRDPSITLDYFTRSWSLPRERHSDPARLIRSIGTWFGGEPVREAANVNTLGEVPNSSWFTNRIGLFAFTPAQVARGPGSGTGPDRSGPWVVVSAKTQGVTPGFNIRDARGDIYVIKFDPPGYLGMTTGAGVIANRVLYAAGYNVPEDVVVTFARDDIVLGQDVRIKTEDGSKRPMTQGDIDAILDEVESLGENRWRAIASKFLSGKPMGPFDYEGRRADDPNDRVDHQDRRELRGLEMFAAWLNHFDTKQHNSLDMYVGDQGRNYVRHYLIDFASTLGAGANGPHQRYGYEYSFDPKSMLRRLFTLGLVEDRWRRRDRDPELIEVGYYGSEYFHPGKFRPLQPNTAFANHTRHDRYWAAKIIAAFRDEHIDAVVAQAHYREPASRAHIARVMGELRDIIARYCFDRVAPLDFFVYDGDDLDFSDLGERYHVYPGTTPRYRARVAAVDADRDRAGGGDWFDLADTRVPGARLQAIAADPARYPFAEIELQVDRGQGWSRSVHAFVARGSGRVVAVDR